MIRITSMAGMIVVLSLGLMCPEIVGKENQQAYVCLAAEGPIEVDGQLNEQAWQRAQVVKVSHAFQPEDVTNLPSTTARLLWDESSMYIAWESQDSDIKSYSDTNDDDLSRGDVVELFIRPGMHNRVYHQFSIAPNGALFDARYPSRMAKGNERFKRWKSGARIATHVDGTDGDATDTDKRYTVEAAIPLAAFVEAGTIEAGTAWTFGLFRCDYSNTLEKPLKISSLRDKLDPTHGFHSYELYQPIRFEASLRTEK